METESSLKLLLTFPEPFDGHTPRRATGEERGSSEERKYKDGKIVHGYVLSQLAAEGRLELKR